MPGFTGTANTTVTTGFSMRIERNCESVSVDTNVLMMVLNLHKQRWPQLLVSLVRSASYLTDGGGCATRKTDGYGNACQKPSQEKYNFKMLMMVI